MKKIILAFSCFFLVAVAMAQKTYIWCGTLIDGISNESKKNMTIVVEKNKIVAVETGYSKPGAADKAIDLKTKTVTPGWIDMHVHVEGETKKGALADRFTQNPTDVAFESLKYANVTLLAGFTTVRDLGGSGVNNSLRNAAELLGQKDILGSIESGKLADIIAMDGDPLKNAAVFGKVVFVMKDGVVYKQ